MQLCESYFHQVKNHYFTVASYYDLCERCFPFYTTEKSDHQQYWVKYDELSVITQDTHFNPCVWFNVFEHCLPMIKTNIKYVMATTATLSSRETCLMSNLTFHAVNDLARTYQYSPAGVVTKGTEFLDFVTHMWNLRSFSAAYYKYILPIVSKDSFNFKTYRSQFDASPIVKCITNKHLKLAMLEFIVPSPNKTKCKILGLDTTLTPFVQNIGFEYKKISLTDGVYSVYVHLKVDVTRQNLKELRRLYPYTSLIDQKRQTTDIANFVWYLLNPKPDNARPIADTYSERMLLVNKVLKHIAVGTNQVMTMTMLTMGIGHKCHEVIMDNILKPGILLRNTESQHAVLREFSTAVKRSSKSRDGTALTGNEMSGLINIELAFGRSMNFTNWENEIANRTGPIKHINLPDDDITKDFERKFVTDFAEAPARPPDEEFYSQLYTGLLADARVILAGQEIDESFSSFMQRRHEWCTSGSSSGQHIQLDPQNPLLAGRKKKRTKYLLNKRGYYETVDVDDFVNKLYESEPSEVAKGSEKFENGKSRAIYGVEPTHYAINSYGTEIVERYISKLDGVEKGITGTSQLAAERFRCLITKQDMTECTMLDYSDFNIQHTARAQAMIFEALAEVGKEMKFHDDWIQSQYWVARAKFNSSFRVPNDITEYAVTQGMFSGTRSTDLINTLLNRRYLLIAIDYVSTHYHVQPENMYHVHQGDDVWLSNSKRHWAAVVFYVLNAMGFVFNPLKQMFGHHRGEFLRVYYNRGTAYGYSARAIINYFLRPLQGVSDVFIEQWIRTLNASFATLYRRGIDLPLLNTLYDCDMLYYTLIKSHVKDERPIKLPLHILQSSTTTGGFGCPRPGNFTIYRGDIPNKPAIECKAPPGYTTLPSNMTRDWIQYLRDKRPDLNKTIRESSLREICIMSNYADLLRELGHGPNLLKYKNDWSSYLAEHYPDRSGNSDTHKALTEHFHWDQQSDLKKTAEFVLKRTVQCDCDRGHSRNFFDLLTNLDPIPIQGYLNVIGLLNRLSTQSLFKDISTTARALNMTKVGALFWIISNTEGHINHENPDYYYLTKLVSDKREDVLEFLSRDMFCGLEWLTYTFQPNQILAVSNEAKQTVVALTLSPFSQLYQCPVDTTMQHEALRMALNNLFVWLNVNAFVPKIHY